jgi:predicted membrane chloride channel (bestrophin family)
MSIVLSGCERIATTPVPFAYTLILHRTVYLFCIMLPFALVVDLHYMTPFVSALISTPLSRWTPWRKSWKTRLAQKITTCRWTPSAT